MRYSNGEVSEAGGYYWYRPEPQGVGGLMQLDHNGNCIVADTGSYLYAEEYKTFSVAACNPLLPIMVTDQDPLVSPTGAWELLRIFHPRGNLAGLSQVVTLESRMGDGGAPVRYVAGRSPSWMPNLLPRTYRSPNSRAPGSAGLGGELPIILGLMALAAERNPSTNDPVDQLFLRQHAWRRYEWKNGNDPPKGCEYLPLAHRFGSTKTDDLVLIDPDTAEDDPCVFLVKVFLDPENPACTSETLVRFEWHTAVVREPSSSSSS
ncbi:hypothetical protein ACHAPT_010710 [Fusarium lateritium]